MRKVTEFEHAGIYLSRVKLPAKPPHKLRPAIPLTDIFNIPSKNTPYQKNVPIQNEFRLHTAMTDSQDLLKRDPYSVLVYGSDEEWLQWNRNTPIGQKYDRDYIFSMVRTPKNDNIWLFGGIFVKQGGPYFVSKDIHSQYRSGRFEYDIYQSVIGRNLIGKMVIGFDRTKGRKVKSKTSKRMITKGCGALVRLKMEECIGQMKVLEILP